MTNKNPSSLPCSPSPWAKNNNTIWLGSTLALTRNLEKFNFPAKLSSDQHKQILSLLTKELMVNQSLKEPRILKAEEMRPLEKEFLMEHFMTSQSFQQAHSGEAFLLDRTCEFLAILNLRDHLVLQIIDSQEELEGALDRLTRIELDLSKSFNFAFSPYFGFLTSDPSQSGTGFLLHVFLHLPGLIYTNRFEDVIKKYKDESIEQTGLQGDPHEMIGDIIVFHNRYTLGLTEENIIASMRSLTTKILVEEKSARSYLRDRSGSEIKDKVSRAYAILLHSYQIETVEALHAISLLKLGLDLEWVENISHQALNELFFNCRRAHLQCLQGGPMSQEDIPHKRAEFIHKALQGVILKI